MSGRWRPRDAVHTTGTCHCSTAKLAVAVHSRSRILRSAATLPPGSNADRQARGRQAREVRVRRALPESHRQAQRLNPVHVQPRQPRQRVKAPMPWPRALPPRPLATHHRYARPTRLHAADPHCRRPSHLRPCPSSSFFLLAWPLTLLLLLPDSSLPFVLCPCVLAPPRPSAGPSTPLLGGTGSDPACHPMLFT